MRHQVRTPIIIATALISAASLAACLEDNPNNDQCMKHCWEGSYAIPDTEEEGVLPGSCVNRHTQAAIAVPIPAIGTFSGRSCIEFQADHTRVKQVMAAAESGSVAGLSPAQVAAWDDLTGKIADEARDACVSYATGGSDHDDIDLGLPGEQSCTNSTALTLCNAAVYEPMLAAFSLSEQGADIAIPSYAGVESGLVAQPECQFIPETTGEEPTGGEPTGGPQSGGGGGDGESGGTGADVTGADEAGVFGDLDDGVRCTGTRCSVDMAVWSRILDRFATFYDEGVTLTIGPTGAPCNAVGAKLGGLGNGEDANDLAVALGLRNGDVITKVEGVSLVDLTAAAAVVNDLQSSVDPITMTVRRKVTPSSCATLSYTITLTGG